MTSFRPCSGDSWTSQVSLSVVFLGNRLQIVIRIYSSRKSPPIELIYCFFGKRPPDYCELVCCLSRKPPPDCYKNLLFWEIASS
ncbi:hypothetical protein V6N13_098730 [Hibiscus sabdariffa]